MAATFENLENSEQYKEAERRVEFARTMHNEAVAANNTPENLLITGFGMMSPGGGIISQIASEARKKILMNWKAQTQALTKGQTTPDILRRRYRELHQIPDEAMPEKTPLVLDPQIESVGTTRTWEDRTPQHKVLQNQIHLNPLRESPDNNTLLHETIHVNTGRGLGADLVEQIKSRTIHNINKLYHKEGYKETYSINPNEMAARTVGALGLDNLKQFTPGQRKIPIEKLKKETSSAINDAFKFSAFADPNKAARGLLSTIAEFKSNPNIPPNKLMEAEKLIHKEVKQYFDFKK